MTLQLKPLTEITHTAIQVLCKEIGVVNTIRFFSTGHGNYTEERRQLFGDLSLDNIVAEIKQMRKPEPS